MFEYMFNFNNLFKSNSYEQNMVDIKKQGTKPRDYTSIFSLEDRVAIVTGGTGHLGASVSKTLAAFGAKVVVLSRNKENLNKFMDEYSKAFSDKFDAEVCDVTNPVQVDGLIKKTIEKYKGIDILVNAAYQKQNKRFEEMSLADWNTAMKGAQTSYFLCTKAVSPFMLKKGKGSVINIASLYSFLGTDSRIFLDLGNCPGVDYAVAKGGILQMTRYLATRWASKGIRVNAISPGYFPKMNPGKPERKDYITELCKRTPMARIGQSDELAGAIVYLASDASSFVTGHNLVVDGGWSSW